MDRADPDRSGRIYAGGMSPRPEIRRVDLGVRHVPYEQGWQFQRRLHAEVAAGVRPSIVLLLEHEPVFTAGRRTQPQDRPVDGSPVVDVDRGGRITWHGPGQIVGYPIVRLADPIDVVAYVRRLEELLITVCADFGVIGARVEGRSGVWIEGGTPRKIAAIGVRVARGVTMHGFAMNVNCDLGAYQRIVPCGIADADVTSLALESPPGPGIAEVADRIEAHIDLLVEPRRWD